MLELRKVKINCRKNVRLNVGDFHAVGWDEGPWALVTPVKVIRVGVGFKKMFRGMGSILYFCAGVKCYPTYLPWTWFHETMILPANKFTKVFDVTEGAIPKSQQGFTELSVQQIDPYPLYFTGQSRKLQFIDCLKRHT